MDLDVFACGDIQDFYAQIRARYKSVRGLSKKLGYRSDRNLGMVLTGTRSMSEPMQDHFTRFLKLTPHESRYLSLLVQKERATRTGRGDSAMLDKEIAKLRPAKLASIPLPTKDLKELAQWYYHVVVDVVEALGPKADARRILKSFKGKVSAKEMDHCLERQVELGRLSVKDGVFARTGQGAYWCDGEVPSAFLRETHRQLIGQALNCIEDQGLDQRHLIAITLPIEKEKVAYAKKRVNEVMRELLKELSAPETASNKLVYQLNLQLFEQADPTE